MNGSGQVGWFVDPLDPSRARYWDGQQWTSQTKDVPAGAPLAILALPVSLSPGSAPPRSSREASRSTSLFAPTGPDPRAAVAEATVRLRPSVDWRAVGIVALLVILIGGGVSGYLLLSKHQVDATVTMTVVGSSCDDSAYGDMSQVVVRDERGNELARADLNPTRDVGYLCAYAGRVAISSDAHEFLVSDRSGIRPPVRMTRRQIEKDGIQLSVGECTDARVVDDGAACMAELAASAH